ncbi:hypothetical protein SAMN05661080_02177 [Modestobacter sp. DSM 44400]|nr:hypothetical protein [Modestobacter sp. DSM 44400]SDY05697.1 hypothetical protein SAMN05661080_02177 [Modestobacter sp. DSM 44400]
MDAAVARALPGWRESAEASEAADLARRAAEAVDVPGRPLAAANAGLPWPDAPHLVLWQALTTLREHRGDGHLAALLQHELLVPGRLGDGVLPGGTRVFAQVTRARSVG